jgi:anaerobic dimethyl sulfoxide reductase subunit A
MGDEDGVPKTPAWAEPFTGVGVSVTEKLAREYATTKPAALIPAWGPGRTIMGEQFHRAANTLCAMTGNIGIPGGFAGGFMRAYPSREIGEKGWRGYLQRNPVEVDSPYRKNSLYRLRGAAKPISARIHGTKLYDAILQGKAGGYPTDIKMAMLVNQNTLNQSMNVNKGVRAFKALEFIVNVENRMTPTAKFADILLPVNGAMERNDIATSWLGEPCYIYVNKAIETLYDTKSDYDICCELAPRLGIENFGEGKTEDEWLRHLSQTRPQDIPDYDAFKAAGVQKVKLAEPVVAFKQQIEDPQNNPFPTLSGKKEIFSEHLAEWNNPLLPPIPKYIEGPEGPSDPLKEKYPLQLLTRHPKLSAHSSMQKIPWLTELEPNAAGMNPADAIPRGISDGDKVMVFNDRGKIVLPARLTERVMPGVVDIRQGAWYDPDENGVDQGGNPNVLTLDEHSPGGAYPTNGALVQIKKLED